MHIHGRINNGCAPATSGSLRAGCDFIDVVIPAADLGLGSVWTNGTPRSLLPLPGSTIIEAMLARVFTSGNTTCMISANGTAPEIARQLARNPAFASRVFFCQETVPRGTAGCIKACEANLRGDVVVVVDSGVWLDDDPQWLIEQHRNHGNAITVFCSRDSAAQDPRRGGHLQPAGVYCCDVDVLKLIPTRGYQDLKEQLIPAVQRRGLRVGAVVVHGGTREVSSWDVYMHVLSQTLSRAPGEAGYREIAPTVWVGRGVEIAANARIVGPAFLGHHCTIADHAVVIGPAVLGEGSHLGGGSWLMRAVAPPGTRIPAKKTYSDQLIVCPPEHTVVPLTEACESTRAAVECERDPGSRVTASRPASPLPRPYVGTATERFGGLVLAGLFVWAFWQVWADLWHVWQSNPDYGAGLLVPFAAVYMIATRRRAFRGLSIRLSPLGMLLFAVGFALILIGNYYFYRSVQRFGLVVCANGLVMSAIGWRGYKRVWYPMFFLFLMIPLPNRVYDAIMLPLQGLSARAAAGVLEIIGVPVECFGHVLEVGGHQVAVAEACSGLRMALAFLVVAGLVAFIVARPRWQKAVVVVSSIPIAVACNVARIVGSAYVYSIGYHGLAEGMLHEAAGLLMMPAALYLIFLELRVLAKLASKDDGSDGLAPASELVPAAV